MRLMRRRILVVFLLLTIGGAASVKAQGSCLTGGSIQVCAISVETGTLNDGWVKIVNPTECAVRVAFWFSGETANTCLGVPCRTANDYTGPKRQEVAANSTVIVLGVSLPHAECPPFLQRL